MPEVNRSSPFTLLKSANFRRFWLGQTFSEFGDRIATIALLLYVTIDLHSVAGLGAVLAIQGAALALFLFLGGVWADRVPRKRLIIVTDLICFGLHALLAALIFTHSAALWQVILIEAGFGICEAMYRPAFAGLLPQTVEEESIEAAWGLSQAAHSAALALGPLVGTGLVLGIGAGWAFSIDALTFLASAITVWGIKARNRGIQAPDSGGILKSLREGWGEVRSRVWVWSTIGAWSLLLLLTLAPWFVLAPTVSTQIWGTAGVYGAHEAFFGLGTICGALGAAKWRSKRPMRRGYILMTLWPIQFIVFGLGAPLPLVYISAIAAGVGLGSFSVIWESALARWIPPARLSRVSSWDWMGSLALMPIGYALAGPLATLIDPAKLIVGAGIAGAFCVALGALPRETRALGPGPKDRPGR